MHKDNRLIKSAFMKMMVVNMFVIAASNLCGFIDNLVTGRLLGTEALAAVGFFSPLATIIGLFNVIVIGAQVLCGNYIGAGKKEQLSSMFINNFVFLGLFFSGFAIMAMIQRDRIAAMLGAEGAVQELLSGYIAGYMPGIPAQAMCALLMALVPFNNEMKRSYLSGGIMVVGNALGDILMSGLGTFGIGLASTVCNVLVLCILLPGFFNKQKAIHFQPVQPEIKSVVNAAYRGSCALMFTIGLLAKNVLMIRTLSARAGDVGVACMNVMGSVCGILGIISGGFGMAYLSLAGIYYGEEDRVSFIGLFRIALRIGETCFIPTVLLIAAFSSVLSAVFFDSGTQSWEMGKQMFMLGFWFFPVNIFYNCMVDSYNARGQMKIVNVMSVAEVAMVGVFTALTVPRFGVAAAWLANAWVDIIFAALMIIYAWIRGKKADFKISSILAIPESFGASPDDFREYSIKTMEEVICVSESVTAFCKEKKLGKEALYAGICIEEMAKNVIQHGAQSEKHPYVDVRVVVGNGLTLRIRDNCAEFDPRKRLELFNPGSPEQNIGIRLTAKLAGQIDYYNNAGINTLIMKL